MTKFWEQINIYHQTKLDIIITVVKHHRHLVHQSLQDYLQGCTKTTSSSASLSRSYLLSPLVSSQSLVPTVLTTRIETNCFMTKFSEQTNIYHHLLQYQTSEPHFVLADLAGHAFLVYIFLLCIYLLTCWEPESNHKKNYYKSIIIARLRQSKFRNKQKNFIIAWLQILKHHWQRDLISTPQLIRAEPREKHLLSLI